ncbi:MAG TPA: glycosyltransferase family 39 protein [Anaerolineae bacterium]|nr:glycosyltransferase family 39 protein [Anaerolineae bacterium]HQH38099.1 glycosyltransferase family 39 protein [Anaerolineae bacterium]
MNRSRLTPAHLRVPAIILITLLAAFLRLYHIDRLPPGDGYDPAYYGIDALEILRGARPIFLLTNFGREALFSYLVAVWVLIFGPTALAVHLASAVVGILTIPAIYFLAEELFFEETPPVRFLGSVSAALMVAVSYWHLNWSRYGVRAILVPFFAAWTIYFLWRGLRTQSRWVCGACGVMLGLSLYTYQAARLLPVLVVIGFICHFVQRRAFARRDVENFLIIVGISMVIFAPLGWFFIEHPGAFSERIQQAAVLRPSQSTAENEQAFRQQLMNALLLFGIRGDAEPYSTIPGRPVLNIFFAGLFYVGLVICLIQYKKPRYMLVLAWWVVMLVPAALAGRGAEAKRAIGTLPAVALLIAITVVSLWKIVPRRSTNASPRLRRYMQPMYAGLLVGGFVYSGMVTFHDYFVTWAANPNLFTHFEVGISMIGEYIRTLPADEQIYVSPDTPDHPGIRFHSGLRDNVEGYNGRVCIVMPAKTTTHTTYIIAPSKDKQGLAQLQAHYPQGQIVYNGPGNYGEPYFRAFRVPAQSTVYITPTHPLSIQWGPSIQLLGYDMDETAFLPGNTVRLNLYYQGNAPVAINYTAFVHLLGPTDPASGSPLWAQNDSEPCHAFYPTSLWKAGEIIKDTITLQLPPDMPSGTYTLATGFYNLLTMERLPVTSGEARDNVAVLGNIDYTK